MATMRDPPTRVMSNKQIQTVCSNVVNGECSICYEHTKVFSPCACKTSKICLKCWTSSVITLGETCKTCGHRFSFTAAVKLLTKYTDKEEQSLEEVVCSLFDQIVLPSTDSVGRVTVREEGAENGGIMFLLIALIINTLFQFMKFDSIEILQAIMKLNIFNEFDSVRLSFYACMISFFYSKVTKEIIVPTAASSQRNKFVLTVFERGIKSIFIIKQGFYLYRSIAGNNEMDGWTAIIYLLFQTEYVWNAPMIYVKLDVIFNRPLYYVMTIMLTLSVFIRVEPFPHCIDYFFALMVIGTIGKVMLFFEKGFLTKSCVLSAIVPWLFVLYYYFIMEQSLNDKMSMTLPLISLIVDYMFSFKQRLEINDMSMREGEEEVVVG